MAARIDLDNLRLISGGDVEMEKELFLVFKESSEVCINGLRSALAKGDDAEWKLQAHALKGNSFNLGAMVLGEICSKAQDAYKSPADEKQKLLVAIETELANLQVELDKLAG